MGDRICVLSMRLEAALPVLRSLDLKASEDTDPDNETPASGAAAGDTYLIWVNDDARFISHDDLMKASDKCSLLTLRANETVMYSEITEYTRGKPIWSLIHGSDQGADHLAGWGSPPAEWQGIADRLRAEQEGDEETDMVMDIPVTLFESLTGFRYDQVHDLPFVVLERST